MNKSILIFSMIALTGALIYFNGSSSSKEAPSETELSQFNSFRLNNNKVYSSQAEAGYRFKIFQQNLQKIQKHNANINTSYTLGVNPFADLTFEEFKAFYLVEDPEDLQSPRQEQGKLLTFDLSSAPVKQVDWRKKKVLGEIKNQGSCGSCWAFSAIGVVEAAFALFNNEKLVLSEQELVDCSEKYGNDGCNGGFSYQGLDYIRENNINNNEDYPYVGKDQKCKKVAGKGEKTIAQYTLLPKGPEPIIERLKISTTTVSFSVQDDLFLYKSGIYNPEFCPNPRNHAVNAVGFNLNSKLPYFIIRNSWGPSWGEKGYFRIAIREENGTCWMTGEGRTAYVDLIKTSEI